MRTSRNMAYYPPELRRAHPADQAPAGGPLHAAAGHQGHAGRGPRARAALVELEDRILERALEQREPATRIARAEVRRATTCPSDVLDRLAEIGVLTPDAPRLRRRRRRDHRGDRRASAPAATTRRSASPSTTRCATARRCSRSSRRRSASLLERLAGEVEPDRAAEIIASGAEPLRELHRRDALQAAARRAAPPARRALNGVRLRPTACQRANWCVAGGRSRYG